VADLGGHLGLAHLGLLKNRALRRGDELGRRA
jgi:hypothetical protein